MRWILLSLILVLPSQAFAQFGAGGGMYGGEALGALGADTGPVCVNSAESELSRARELVGSYRERQVLANQIVGENQAIRRYVCDSFGCGGGMSRSYAGGFSGGFSGGYGGGFSAQQFQYTRPQVFSGGYESEFAFAQPVFARERFVDYDLVGFHRGRSVDVNVNVYRERERRRLFGGGGCRSRGGGCGGGATRASAVTVNAFGF